ncbi:MAG: hypothetical protein QM627_09495 [Luteolibacter sp.]
MEKIQKNPSSQPVAIPENLQTPPSLVPVEILEKGHATKVLHIPIQTSPIPEISSLLLAPLGLALFLRRQR